MISLPPLVRCDGPEIIAIFGELRIRIAETRLRRGVDPVAQQGSAGGRRFPQWIWPATIAGLIVAASHRPRLAAPEIEHGDKVVHFAVYGLLATLVCRLGTGWRAAGWSLLAVSGFGVLDEWHQSFVPGRFSSVADWIADTLGAAVAVTMYVGWSGYRRLLELRIGRTEKM